MKKLEQAARQALEALIKANHFHDYEDEITALREALAEQKKPLYRKVLREMLDAHEQAEQEPVAWMIESTVDGVGFKSDEPPASVKATCKCTPLYAAPVRTKDLTDKELEDAFKELGGKWNGDMWTIEDADLHPCLRKLISNGYGK